MLKDFEIAQCIACNNSQFTYNAADRRILTYEEALDGSTVHQIASTILDSWK